MSGAAAQHEAAAADSSSQQQQQPGRARLLILYGSQTGNAQARRGRACCALPAGPCAHLAARALTRPAHAPAQDAAERLGREAYARHYAPVVCSTAAFPPETLPSEPRVVFVVSTTGQARTRL